MGRSAPMEVGKISVNLGFQKMEVATVKFMPEQSSLVVTQQAHGKRAGLGASQLPISSLG